LLGVGAAPLSAAFLICETIAAVIVTMKRIDGEWKISGVEEHPDGR
jgi:hypothetical protein